MLMQPSLAFMDAIQNDPLHDLVVLNLFGYGADGSTAFKDHSKYKRAITTNGTVTNDAGTDVKGTPSINFGSSNANYLSCAYGAELSTIGQDCCIEGYLRTTTLGVVRIMYSRRHFANPDGFVVFTNADNTVGFAWYYGGAGPRLTLTSTSTVTSGEMLHFRISRVSGVTYLSLRGVVEHSGTQSGDENNPAQPLIIGRDPTNSGRYLRGWLNWVQITIGDGRGGDADFTPPPVPLSVF